MTRQVINTGTNANDGSGTPLRTAMGYINQNFAELYSDPPVSNTISVNTAVAIGNSTINNYTNSSMSIMQNAIGNTVIQTGSYAVANGTGTLTLTPVSLSIAANGSSNVFIGNSTVNSVAMSASYAISNATGNTTMTPHGLSVSANGSVKIGNSTSNVSMAIGSLYLANATSNVSITQGRVFVGNSTTNSVSNSSAHQAPVIIANTRLAIGNAAGYDFSSVALAEVDSNQNTYTQFVLQNANSGVNGSTDLVLTSDTGTDTQNYLDIGINSSNYANASYTVVNAYGAYMYSQDSSLAIGTASNNGLLLFHTNGTTVSNIKMAINATAVAVQNTTTLFGNNATMYGTVTVGGVASNSTGTINVGDSVSNVYINATSIVAGTMNSAAIGVTGRSNTTFGVYGWSNSSVGVRGASNSNYGAMITSTTNAAIYIGNNTTEFVRVSPTGTLSIGNSSPTSTDALSINGNVTVSSNTLVLGTSSATANGYTYLPNRLKFNWGWVLSNSTIGAASFTSAFTTNAFSVTATSNTVGSTYVPVVTAWTKTGATILTGNTTGCNVFFMAIGV